MTAPLPARRRYRLEATTEHGYDAGTSVKTFDAVDDHEAHALGAVLVVGESLLDWRFSVGAIDLIRVADGTVLMHLDRKVRTP